MIMGTRIKMVQKLYIRTGYANYYRYKVKLINMGTKPKRMIMGTKIKIVQKTSLYPNWVRKSL